MKEMRVYVIDTYLIEEENAINYTDNDFMEVAERLGTVFTLKGFENAFNNEELNTHVDYIRFIEVEV